MPCLRRHPRLTWLALWAVLAAALLPAVSHALARSGGDAARWVELCTAQGMRLVVLDDGAADKRSLPAHAAPLEHCALCTPGGGAAPLPSAPGPRVLAVSSPARVQPPALQAPRTRLAWRSAQPRGPPRIA